MIRPERSAIGTPRSRGGHSRLGRPRRHLDMLSQRLTSRRPSAGPFLHANMQGARNLVLLRPSDTARGILISVISPGLLRGRSAIAAGSLSFDIESQAGQSDRPGQAAACSCQGGGSPGRSSRSATRLQEGEGHLALVCQRFRPARGCDKCTRAPRRRRVPANAQTRHEPLGPTHWSATQFSFPGELNRQDDRC